MYYTNEQELRERLDRVERKLDQVLSILMAGQGAKVQATAPDPFAQVREAVRQGRKIEAIKIYRELTGVHLKEAKEAVEAMEQQGARAGAASAPPGSASLGTSHAQLEQVRALVAQNRKIDAIKLYRELTQVGLVEAKNAVEAMMDELPGGSAW